MNELHYNKYAKDENYRNFVASAYDYVAEGATLDKTFFLDKALEAGVGIAAIQSKARKYLPSLALREGATTKEIKKAIETLTTLNGGDVTLGILLTDRLYHELAVILMVSERNLRCQINLMINYGYLKRGTRNGSYGIFIKL